MRREGCEGKIVMDVPGEQALMQDKEQCHYILYSLSRIKFLPVQTPGPCTPCTMLLHDLTRAVLRLVWPSILLLFIERWRHLADSNEPNFINKNVF